ncbi:3-ketoacyl-CoA thiolase, peroxisomal [Quaeritorhiza haematococci]|nr:3-ketoacyl-CoA thiolase, peroxisomal [Quaeritorhiza haematococci]
MASSRINQIASHLNSGPNQVGVKHPDDVVIVAAVRTPITRARKGGFKDTFPEELLTAALKGVLDRTHIDPQLVEDINVGCTLPPGGGQTISRMAAFAAGFPDTTSVAAVNRQCSSGLQACAYIAAAISNGTIDVGIGAGFESMTKGYGPGAMPSEISEKVNSIQSAADCMIPMGLTSENVAREFHVSRQKQDEFSALSHQRAAAAWQNGLYNEEVIPVTTTFVEKDGTEKTITVTKDDGVRANTTAESLAKLKPAFSDDGSTTAGNASQVSDGAAAVLMMKRKKAQELGLPIVGKFVAFAVAGVPPRVMGIGPAFAIPKVLEKAGLATNDVDVYEINEAFASQCVYSIEKLGLDWEKVNPKGGAIAIGHPLGCTGARQIATILPELKRQGKRIGVTSMCIGTGMGAASVIEAEY